MVIYILVVFDRIWVREIRDGLDLVFILESCLFL